jgi:hypothetical protein
MASVNTRFHRLAKVGEKVTPTPKAARPGYPAGTVGTVVEQLHGACGPILAVRFPGYGVVDLFWKKVRRAGT